jgi:hypothetical protein
MTDDNDAEVKIIQDRMHRRCVERFMADGMTEQEATARAWEILHAPWPADWPPLPTFEELGGDEPMSDAERAESMAWLMTDPLPELSNVITVREIVNTDELAVCTPKPGCPLPQGSWGAIVSVRAGGDAYLVEFEAPWQVLELQRSDMMPTEPIEYADMTPEQQRIVNAGKTIAGSFPLGMSKEELCAWISKRFIGKD